MGEPKTPQTRMVDRKTGKKNGARLIPFGARLILFRCPIDTILTLLYNSGHNNYNDSEGGKIAMGKREERTEIDYNPDNKMTVSNTYIRAVHPDRMGVNSMKLFRLAITQCRMNDKEFFEYSAYPGDLAKAFGTNRKDIYRDIAKHSKDLLQSIIVYGDGNPHHKKGGRTIFSRVEYDPETKEIYIKLNPDVTELFLQLKRNFTQIPICSILAMKSKHSIRIYELICQELRGSYPFADTAMEVVIPLEAAREITGTDVQTLTEKGKKKTINKSYDHVGHFRAKVLQPALEDIETAASWHIECKDIKRRNKITGFSLTIWTAAGWQMVQKSIQSGEPLPRPKHRQDPEQPEQPEMQIPGQMSLMDWIQE